MNEITYYLEDIKQEIELGTFKLLLKEKGQYVITLKNGCSGQAVCMTENWIEIRLVDTNGKPLADRKFRLWKGTNTILYEGTLDGDGYARIEPLFESECEIEIIT